MWAYRREQVNVYNIKHDAWCSMNLIFVECTDYINVQLIQNAPF